MDVIDPVRMERVDPVVRLGEVGTLGIEAEVKSGRAEPAQGRIGLIPEAGEYKITTNAPTRLGHCSQFVPSDGSLEGKNKIKELTL